MWHDDLEPLAEITKKANHAGLSFMFVIPNRSCLLVHLVLVTFDSKDEFRGIFLMVS